MSNNGIGKARPHLILTNFCQASGFRSKNLNTSPISSVS